MSVTPNFRTYVLEQLARGVQDIRGKGMFGGIGIYAGNVFFALIADDTLYFKVDDSTRTEFEQRGMDPFRPYGEAVMHYYRVPEDVLEDADDLCAWADKSIAVARRAKSRKR
jgi:DNA transformation protein